MFVCDEWGEENSQNNMFFKQMVKVLIKYRDN